MILKNIGLGSFTRKTIVLVSQKFICLKETNERCKDKDFHLGVGEGLCWVKWIKKVELEKRFYFPCNLSLCPHILILTAPTKYILNTPLPPQLKL